MARQRGGTQHSSTDLIIGTAFWVIMTYGAALIIFIPFIGVVGAVVTDKTPEGIEKFHQVLFNLVKKLIIYGGIAAGVIWLFLSAIMILT